jgi:endonuclease/exonuclease/phosphatase family metal-dependent hydrolase
MLRVASYNAHDCIGRDRVYSPERIAQVVTELNADAVALQEITLDHAGDLLAQLENATGMRAIDGTLFERGVGRYGNLLLTRHPVLGQRVHDLSFPGREPRGIVDAELVAGGQTIKVMATHLGLAPKERSDQIGRISTLLAKTSGPAVLMGDFNVWLGSRAFERLADDGFVQAPVFSYPTWFAPLLRLDRIFVRGPAVAVRTWRHDSKTARVASDHFPVAADLDTGAPRRALQEVGGRPLGLA